jgi:hypothetical protein
MSMKIKMLSLGVPGETGPIEVTVDETLTIEQFLVLFPKMFGKNQSGFSGEKFSVLLNGRNVLSLADKLQTKLQDGDELMVTVQVMGG